MGQRAHMPRALFPRSPDIAGICRTRALPSLGHKPSPAGFRSYRHGLRPLSWAADSDPPHLIRTMMRADPYDPERICAISISRCNAKIRWDRSVSLSRFWQDGSPRLTAYEYQGLLRSKCFRGRHARASNHLHLLPRNAWRRPERAAHRENENERRLQPVPRAIHQPAQLVEHTKHSVESTGSLCYNCHMPSIVYGVMSAHRTHDITIPRPDETVRFDKPNACNQCHLDWSVNRAIAETARLWPKAFSESQTGGETFNEPEGTRALFAGDAVMRT